MASLTLSKIIKCYGKTEVIHGVDLEVADGAAGLREIGVFVETLSAVSEMLDECVDEDVGWAGVEGEDLRRIAGSGQDRDVGDAAEV